MPKAHRAVLVTRLPTATRINDNESAQLLEALRANQQLLRDLMLRYDRSVAPGASLRKRSVTPTICTPRDVWDVFGEEMSCLAQEQLPLLLPDTKHRLMRWEMVYQGAADAITVRPAELLRPAVLENAPAVLLLHDHPSGDPTPSPEDIQTTEHIMAAGKLLSIDVLDHVVLGKNGRYVSLQQRGQFLRANRVGAA
jgi:DNA repair protein RadC